MITVLVAIDLPEPHEVPGDPIDAYVPELGDVAEAVYARLDEFYPDSTGGFAVPYRRRVVATTKPVAGHMLTAAAVGLSHEATGGLDVAAYAALTAITGEGNAVTAVDPSRL